MTQTKQPWSFNPLRGSRHLPPDVDVLDIDWAPLREAAEPTATELARVRSGILAHVTGA